MEWVEVTGKSVEEATAVALEQLGIAYEEAEIEVLEEAKAGLFGRVRGESRVRARVRPTSPRPKAESPRGRGSRGPKAAADASAPAPAERAPRRRPASPPRDEAGSPDDPAVIAAGTTFLTGLLEAFGVDANVTTGSQGPYLEFRIDGDPSGLGVLIGPKAQTLQAVQELLRTVIFHQVGETSVRVLLDVASYRERRRVALEAFTHKVAAEVQSTGERRVLEPMSAMDRKVVHDTAGTIDGVVSQSEGEDPYRRVVLVPA
jgi:spoIIIJ-associated protein